jgi:hypothetical protein
MGFHPISEFQTWSNRQIPQRRKFLNRTPGPSKPWIGPISALRHVPLLAPALFHFPRCSRSLEQPAAMRIGLRCGCRRDNHQLNFRRRTLHGHLWLRNTSNDANHQSYRPPRALFLTAEIRSCRSGFRFSSRNTLDLSRPRFGYSISESKSGCRRLLPQPLTRIFHISKPISH